MGHDITIGYYSLFYEGRMYYNSIYRSYLWEGPNFKHEQVFGVFSGNAWEARAFVDLRESSKLVYGWD